MKIIPAVLAYDKADFDNKIALAAKMSEQVQIDIVDKSFNTMASIGAVDLDRLYSSREQSESRSLKGNEFSTPPGRSNNNLINQIDINFHLMVEKPLEVIDRYLKYNPYRITIHHETVSDPKKLFKLLPKKQLAIAINPGTSAKAISGYLDYVSEVLVMTVEPGATSRQFLEHVLKKITNIKQLESSMTISVDGGVSQNTIEQIKKSGTDIAYAGSALFNEKDPVAAYHQLQARAYKDDRS